jgi:hypothetical protein
VSRGAWASGPQTPTLSSLALAQPSQEDDIIGNSLNPTLSSQKERQRTARFAAIGWNAKLYHSKHIVYVPGPASDL